MNKQELNKKLAEFAGFQWLKATDGNYHWFDKDGDIVSPTDGEGNVIWDLDACFKWIMPEHIAEITFMYASNCVSCDIEDLEGNFFKGHVNTESIKEAWTKSALALSLAIEKLIDEEVKGQQVSHEERLMEEG